MKCSASGVGDSEDEVFWRSFLSSLRRRGLTGVRLVISDVMKERLTAPRDRLCEYSGRHAQSRKAKVPPKRREKASRSALVMESRVKNSGLPNQSLHGEGGPRCNPKSTLASTCTDDGA